MQHVPILNQMALNYKLKHGRLPNKITLTPLALALLAIRRSASVNCMGVPVEARLFDEQETALNGPNLGVFVYENGSNHELRAVDLA